MQTQNQNQNNSTETTKVETTSKVEKTPKVKKEKKETVKDAKNLESLLSKMQLPTKGVSTKTSIYKDTEHLKSFDGGKKFRQKMRSDLIKKYLVPVFTSLHAKEYKKAQENFNLLNSFLKANYSNPSLSLQNIYGGKDTSPIATWLQDAINIIVQAKKENKIK